MRTTIRLDDQLLKEAKQLAARTGKSLTSVIEDALQEVLARQHQPVERKPVHLTTFSGNGPLPGIDLDDSASILDLMEAKHDLN